MDAFDRLSALFDLLEGKCALKHLDQPPQAVNYISQGFGTGEEVEDTLIIPVCVECYEALQGDEWVLLYCYSCGASQWLLRDLARRSYTETIVWMCGCPKCVSTTSSCQINKWQF